MQGEIELLEKVMEGANAEVDEAAEERKGGAGDLGGSCCVLLIMLCAVGRAVGCEPCSGQWGCGHCTAVIALRICVDVIRTSNRSNSVAGCGRVWAGSGQAATGGCVRSGGAQPRQLPGPGVCSASWGRCVCRNPCPHSRPHPSPRPRRPPGKMFLSAGDKQLALLCHVPKELAAAKNVTMQAWVEAVTKVLKGAQVGARGRGRERGGVGVVVGWVGSVKSV